MCACVCVRVGCVCARVSTCVYVCVCACVSTCVHACMCVCARTCLCACVRVCLHTRTCCCASEGPAKVKVPGSCNGFTCVSPDTASHRSTKTMKQSHQVRLPRTSVSLLHKLDQPTARFRACACECVCVCACVCVCVRMRIVTTRSQTSCPAYIRMPDDLARHKCRICT